MAVEHVRTTYVRLFEVRVLHHYWLDEGATSFDTLAEPVRTRRLLTYDVRKLVSVEASAGTRETIAGLRGVFRTTKPGFLVAVPEDAMVPENLFMEFYLTAADHGYATYTGLSLRPRTVTDVTDPADTSVVHRYRANVPVLSNLTGAVTGEGADERLFLSRPYVDGAEAGDGVEALLTVDGEVRQLTSDPPGASFQVLGPVTGQPVYLHQGDVPRITAPPGSTGAPAAGIEVTPGMPSGVIAVVRLFPRRDDQPSHSFANADCTPVSPPRVYEVHLRNRWTFWRYRNSRTGSVISTESAPLPLAHFSRAGTRRRPSTAAVDIERDNATPRRITRLVSDIYV